MNTHTQIGSLMARNLTGEAPPAGEPQNEMGRMIARLQATDEQIVMIRDRLDRIVTRAFGEGSPEKDKQQSAPRAAGTVGAIGALLDSIGQELDRTTAALARLDTLA